LLGWGVTVKVIVEDCNKYKNYAFECDTSFSAISSDDAYAGTATNMMVTGAALLGVAAALAVFIRRRQITVDNNEEQQSGFEMMKDSSAVQA
jgi:methylthioribose-1-phosphate isomerase